MSPSGKKRTPDEAGLGGLLGGYGSGSDEEDPAALHSSRQQPHDERGVPSSSSMRRDAREAEEDAGPSSIVGGLVTGNDDEDEAAAGPAGLTAGFLGARAKASCPCPEEEDAPAAAACDVAADVVDVVDPEAADVGPARPSAAELTMAYPSAEPPCDDGGGDDDDDERGDGADVGPSRPGAADLVTGVYPELSPEAPPRVHSAPSRFVGSARIPPPPPGECDQVMPSGDSLQSTVVQWLELKRRGTSINDQLRSSKGFRNPDFLQSVVEHFNINQHGTMFSKDVFDPAGYTEEDFYDALAQAQRKENEKRERERRERGAWDRGVDFASGGLIGGGGTAIGPTATGVGALAAAAAATGSVAPTGAAEQLQRSHQQPRAGGTEVGPAARQQRRAVGAGLTRRIDEVETAIAQARAQAARAGVVTKE